MKPSFIVDFRITWTFPNSMNATQGHSYWHKLESLCYKDVYLFLESTIIGHW